MKIFGRIISRLTLGAIGIILAVALIAFAVTREARTRSGAQMEYAEQQFR